MLAALLFLQVAYEVFTRLRYGVDFSDESFYAVVAQRLALGDRVFVDELNLRSTAGLLLAPFYWAYLKIAGGTEGVMMFLRHLYFALQLLTAGCVFWFASAFTRRAYAILAAALPVAFVPFSVAGWGYNTLSCFLLTCGIAVILGGVARGHQRVCFAVGGLIHGLACLSYPPLAIPVGVCAVAVWLAARSGGATSKWRSVLTYISGVGVVGVIAGIAIVPNMLDAWPAMMAYEKQLTQPRGWDKWIAVINAVQTYSPASPASLATFVVALLLSWSSVTARRLVLPLMLAYTVYFFYRYIPPHTAWYPAHTLSLHLVIFVALLGFLFVLAGDKRPKDLVLLFGGIAPSFLAGIITAMASANLGCMNGGIGIFAGAVVSVVALSRAIDAPDEPAGTALRPRAPLWSRLLLSVSLAAVPFGIMDPFLEWTYGDHAVSSGQTLVKNGPFKGLYTLPWKAARAEEIHAALTSLVKPGDRLLSYYDFPAAHLSVPTRPAVPTSWTDIRGIYDGAMMDYYKARLTGQAYVIVINGRTGRTPAFEALTQNPARLVKSGTWWRIYREPDPIVAAPVKR